MHVHVRLCADMRSVGEEKGDSPSGRLGKDQCPVSQIVGGEGGRERQMDKSQKERAPS